MKRCTKAGDRGQRTKQHHPFPYMKSEYFSLVHRRRCAVCPQGGSKDLHDDGPVLTKLHVSQGELRLALTLLQAGRVMKQRDLADPARRDDF